MSSNSPKHALFQQFALVAKTLGHADRLVMLEQLGQGEHSVEALALKVGLSIANTSQHLQQLRRAGLVSSRRDGKFVLYKISDPSVFDLLSSIQTVAEKNIAEVELILQNYFNKRDSMAPVSREELLNQSRNGLVTVLDVRPQDEYKTSHLPGAVNIPLGELENRLAELDPKQDIIAYCRGEYCVLSYEAVTTLRESGFNVRRLEEGYPEWQAAGLPVENAST